MFIHSMKDRFDKLNQTMSFNENEHPYCCNLLAIYYDYARDAIINTSITDTSICS